MENSHWKSRKAHPWKLCSGLCRMFVNGAQQRLEELSSLRGFIHTDLFWTCSSTPCVFKEQKVLPERRCLDIQPEPSTIFLTTYPISPLQSEMPACGGREPSFYNTPTTSVGWFKKNRTPWKIYSTWFVLLQSGFTMQRVLRTLCLYQLFLAALKPMKLGILAAISATDNNKLQQVGDEL